MLLPSQAPVLPTTDVRFCSLVVKANVLQHFDVL